jgi:hypothetical protein
MREARWSKFSEFESLVDQRLSEASPDASSIKLVGMLFMRTGQSITDKDIYPSFEFFHRRSGDYIDFYLAGWRHDGNNYGNKETSEWTFNLDDFIKTLDAIESEVDWTYSGGTDLLLMAAIRDMQVGHGGFSTHARTTYKIDLNSVISIPIHTLMKENLIESPDVLLERIISFAKNFKGHDPMLGLMGQEVRVSAVEGIIESVLGLLPKETKRKVDYLKHFAIKDVSKSGKRKSAIVHVDYDSQPGPPGLM